jgi:outer membrane receptor protein involved in Fe transport
VTADPSTERLGGRLQVGTTYISHGDGPGYNVRGSVNAPLSDTAAVRISGFTREDPGYIRNVLTGEEGVNVVQADGGRLSALWAPSEQFSLKLDALLQEIRPRGSDIVDPSLGNAYSQYAVRGSGSSERRTQLYSATLKGRLGDVELVSVTSYGLDVSSILADGTPIYGFFAENIYNVDGATVGATLEVDKWTQEFRASMPLGSAMQWTVGAFYTDENFSSTYNVFANDALSGARVGSLLSVIGPSTYQEYAAFTNFTFVLSERIDVQLGGRLSKVKESFSSDRSGPLSPLFYGSDPSIVPPAHVDDHSFTYLLTPRLKLSADAMIYARLASGYRPGGGNINCNVSIPCKFEADTSRNYEVGFKGSALERRISIDASVYYIDWNNIQITLFNPDFGVSYQDNVGKASSKGVELSVASHPVTGLELSAWANYNDATLSDSLPTTSLGVGNAGDRLPYSSRWSANLSVDQEFPFWADFTGSIGASFVYVGDRKGTFPFPGLPRSTFPSYTQWNLRAGVKYRAWSVDFFANNVGDKRSVIADGGELGFNLFNYTRPREVGLSIARQW